ncbi:site-specific integrase [Bacillus sp. MMSF_3328]|uniref:site-specific integrase n=1 Tax=Bacillus sp. MMSF_3328 TaxID=3047080 RepID=UPI00273EDBD2|nr:site-specific integrase [Bacillus sp. MMSF_3328]
MEFVEPIKDPKKIQAMKTYLLGKNKRDYLLFVLGINSAVRINDLLQLTWGEVLKDNMKIRTHIELKEDKTDKNKKFVIGKQLHKAIEIYMKELGEIDLEDLIFKSRKKGYSLTRQQARRIIKEAAEMVGIEDRIGCHSLRKTFGYNAYTKGYDIAIIQKYLNHSSPSVTLRYIGIDQQQMDDMVLDLDL